MAADLVLHHGNVYTMDRAAPRAEAVAIAGDRIAVVGEDAAMLDLLPRGGRAVDLEGRTVVPGFTDAHLHLLSFGLSLGQIDLAGAATLDEALARVAARAGAVPEGHWPGAAGTTRSGALAACPPATTWTAWRQGIPCACSTSAATPVG